MDYIEAVIETTSAGTELVGDALTEMGLDSFAVDDPHTDAQMMEHIRPAEYVDREEMLKQSARPATVTIYVPADSEGERQLERIRERMRSLGASVQNGVYGNNVDAGTLQVTTSAHNDAEWKDRWKDSFHSTRITDRIVVCPTWEEYTPDQETEIVVRMDPGMAFGTGTHETTALSVRMMEEYLHPGDHVLDIGCGSGILSIIAAKLGARHVTGIDNDPEAVRAASENVVMNGTADIVTIREGDLAEGTTERADLIAANLLLNLILRLNPDVRKLLRPHGIYIMCGILNEQVPRVLEQLNELGFTVRETMTEGGWSSVAAELY